MGLGSPTWPPTGWYLHNWRGLEVILAHPFGLAQPQNLRVAQAAQFALKLIQRVGFGGQSTSDLLSDDLHNLRGMKKAPARPCSNTQTDRLWHQGLARAQALSIAGRQMCAGEQSTDVLRNTSSDGYLGQMTDGDKCLVSHTFQLVNGVE